MSSAPTNELFRIFDARRVKMPELRNIDQFLNGAVGWVKNHYPVLKGLKETSARVDLLESQVQKLGSTAFAAKVAELRDLARLDRLKGDAMDYGLAMAREAALRALGLRPFPCQIMGALAMTQGYVVEMATGEGKTITAALAASLWAWGGQPVHIITVNDYLVGRDAEEMSPIYKMMGCDVGHVVHETTPPERHNHYRRSVVYITSKELLADFLRDQILLGPLRNHTQTAVKSLMGQGSGGIERLLVPGLFRVIVDEADSLMVDEGVTPLIISGSPDGDEEEAGNAALYREAYKLAEQLERDRDFTIDWTVRHVDLTQRGQDHLDELVEAENNGFWRGKRRREELVGQALNARWCFFKDEQYLINSDSEIQIIDEFTGRVMEDRSWRHGLHQAIEVKEKVKVSADKENLARQSFQRFFRSYPLISGMTGTAWEARGEMWQIYQRPIVRIPTNRPCIRTHLPVRMFDTIDEKYAAVVERVCELNERGIPVLLGTRSVLTSEDVSKRLTAKGKTHRVLNATQTAQEASIVAEAGRKGQITVATNMAGRGTDIKLPRDVAALGGLHVISTEPATSGRVDRQLFGRAARQGDPGCAQLFACVQDDLFARHAVHIVKAWRRIGAQRLIKLAQWRAERLARFNRKQVLKSDDWMDQSVPF
jgi:preprotein translocase subunit SecA